LVAPSNATDISMDAEGDIVGFTIPNEGIWSVDEASGEVTFEPNNALVGDPTPIHYTVRETNGDISNEATLSVSYFDPDDPQVQSIGDQFWIDSNANGLMDGNERPIVGATVELLDGNGNPMACPRADMMPLAQRASITYAAESTDNAERCIVQTDENGKYEFEVDPGNYQVRFTLPQEMIDDQYVFNDPGSDRTVIVDNTLTYSVDIVEGETNLDIDAGVSCGCANISGDSADSMHIIMILLMIGSFIYLQQLFRRKEENI